jgi:hypothetical protein
MSLRPAGILALAAGPWTVAAAGELDALVQGLADEVYATRESNSAELLRRAQLDTDAVRKLVLWHFRSDPEPEVRLRCETVLRWLSQNHGFLGVQHRERTYFAADGKSHQGVELVTVMPGQPAHLAGLKVGDTVIEIDGNSLDVDDPSNTFSRVIHRLGVGREAVLKVDRLGEELTVQVTIKALPKEFDTLDPEVRFQQWLKAQGEERRKAGP